MESAFTAHEGRDAKDGSTSTPSAGHDSGIADAVSTNESTSTTPAPEKPAVESMTQILKTSPDLETLRVMYDELGGGGWTQNKGWSRGWTKKPQDCKWTGVEELEGNRVVAINLMKNCLAGTIPRALGNLSCLRELNLKGNLLEDRIPLELFNLRGLTTLNVEHNQLTGNLPAEFGRLVNLRELILAENQFEGRIPKEFSNLASLEILHLRKNLLTGGIPKELKKLTNLREFDVEENRLSGVLPDIFWNMKNLTSFWCRRNELGGELPRSLGNLVGAINAGLFLLQKQHEQVQGRPCQ